MDIFFPILATSVLIIQIEFLTTLAIIGFFNIWDAGFILIAGLSYVLYLGLKKGAFVINNPLDKLAAFLIVFFTVLTFFFHHYSIDGGRDHGAYFAAAINTADTGTLVQKDRHVLTFPGFELMGDNIVPHPSPAYEVWLSSGYIFLKNKGVFIANSILFFYLLIIIYIISKNIFKLSRVYSICALVLFATNYFVVWISRRTLNEDIFLLLFFYSFFTFWFGAKKKNIYISLLSMLSLEVGLMVRIESLFVFLPVLIYTSILYRKTLKQQKKLLLLYISTITLFFLPFLYYFVFIDNSPFIQIITLLTNLALQSGIISHKSSNAAASSIPSFGHYLPLYTINRFRDYFGISLMFFLIITAGFLHYIKNWRSNLHTISVFVLFFGPFLITFINPENASDLPYFLRRLYLFYPLMLLSSILFISYYLQRIKYFLIILLIIINMVQTGKMFTFIEYNGVDKQIKTLDKEIPANSTILLLDGKARNYSTNPYGYLYNISIWATYWHYTSDKDIVVLEPDTPLDESIPHLLEKSYSSPVYVISATPISNFNINNYGTPSQTLGLESRRLIYRGKYTITTDQLLPSALIRYYVDRPGWQYSEVEKLVGNPMPTDVYIINYDFYIYQYI